MRNHRIFADLASVLAFATLTGASAIVLAGQGIIATHRLTASLVILSLAIANYIVWIRFDWTGTDYAQGALATVLVGSLFLLIDFIGGRLFHPALGLIESTTSTPFFLLTVFMCPFCTIALLCGWLRSTLIYSRTH